MIMELSWTHHNDVGDLPSSSYLTLLSLFFFRNTILVGGTEHRSLLFPVRGCIWFDRFWHRCKCWQFLCYHYAIKVWYSFDLWWSFRALMCKQNGFISSGSWPIWHIIDPYCLLLDRCDHNHELTAWQLSLVIIYTKTTSIVVHLSKWQSLKVAKTSLMSGLWKINSVDTNPWSSKHSVKTAWLTCLIQYSIASRHDCFYL